MPMHFAPDRRMLIAVAARPAVAVQTVDNAAGTATTLSQSEFTAMIARLHALWRMVDGN